MGKIKIIGNLFTLIFAGSEVYTTFAAANTGVAQLVEHWSPKPGVGSSSLSACATETGREIFRPFIFSAAPPRGGFFFAPNKREQNSKTLPGVRKKTTKKSFSLYPTNLKKSSYICTRLAEGSFCPYITHYQSQIFD